MVGYLNGYKELDPARTMTVHCTIQIPNSEIIKKLIFGIFRCSYYLLSVLWR